MQEDIDPDKYVEMGMEHMTTQTQRGRKFNPETQTEGDKKQFWKSYWKHKNREKKDQDATAHLQKSKGNNPNYWKMKNQGDRTPWKRPDSYRLNDIKPIKKMRVYDQQQEDEAEAENDLVVTPLGTLP